jgi:predicted metal-dependent phosphoesterase TrpH
MHLLGYFIPQRANQLSEALSELQYHRANRNRIIVERLNELGIDVTFEEVEAEAGGPGSQIGRPHFAAVMVRHRAVPDYQTAFDEYLAKGAKAYIGRRLYRPAEATELMAGAGAVPVLAHPMTMNISMEEIERFADELIEAGLKGIEGYHGDYTFEEQAPLRDLAARRGLIATGGSDYHGDMRPDRKLPGGKAGTVVPAEVLDQLKSAAAELQRS